jgi:hypothetical protein
MPATSVARSQLVGTNSEVGALRCHGSIVLTARGAFASNIEQQTSSIPDYAARKGTTFLFLPTAMSPFCGRKFSSHEFNGSLN